MSLRPAHKKGHRTRTGDDITASTEASVLRLEPTEIELGEYETVTTVA
ncbi:hypothetical protein [Natrinema sp. DC36]|nr:hypothetical protein [Natrinema sp. DC36]